MAKSDRNFWGGDNNSVLKVDFKSKKLIYPSELVRESDNTSNFSQNENFVVFECVCRLLEMGYLPQDLVLEKTWKLGHTGKSGRADITIYKSTEDKKEKYIYAIIECKTTGDEYNKAKKDLETNNEGNQLFSYAAQARSVEWLCLYASNYDENLKKISYKDEIIKFKDDGNVLKLSQSDSSIATFSKASTTSDFFEVWEDTYSKKTYHGLIFNSKAYDIGILPLYKKDLRNFDKNEGLNIKFQEILRHNNVSSRHGAFDILLNIFLVKCYDEQSKDKNEQLDFYYNSFSDNYFTLYKRLLKLFILAMKEFLNEDVYQPKENFVHKVLKSYIGKNRAKAQELIEKEIEDAHLYSAQFFAFKKSYNQKLFNQNGKILAEVVSLFENYRFSHSNKEQFLGEFFEEILNEGFQQNEGIFFTPVPITRFIWNSLPFERFIDTNSHIFPKIIDFACGAGHFLTEGVSALSDYCKENDLSVSDKELSRNFYGIDKDDRLSLTSRINMLLNGASEAKISFIDGLEYDRDFYGENQQIFDILVANPPFSVKGFKGHLSKNVLAGKNGNLPYKVLEHITLDNQSIENAFVERLTHILKPNALAVIILPSTILTNSDTATTTARGILLENFNIHCICYFGNQTFGTTGTNTVILFLSRFDEPPRISELIKDSIEAIFSGENLDDFKDKEFLESYLNLQKISKKDYQAFINKQYPNHKFFDEYYKAFLEQSKTKKDKKFVEFKALNRDEQDNFFNFVKGIEKDKLKYFILTYEQRTLLIESPNDNKEQKKFLGFVISQAKNKNNGLTENGGLLSDRFNRNALNKIAYAIKQSFKGEFYSHEDFDKYISFAKTYHLLSFDAVKFDKKFKRNPNELIKGEVKVDSNPFKDSKYELVRLGEICDLNKFKKQISAEEIENMNVGRGSVKLLPSSKNYDWWTDEITAQNYINEGEVIALGVARYANIKKHKGKFVSANNKLLSIKEKVKEEILFDYVYFLLEIYAQKLYKSGSQYPQFDKNKFDSFLIPKPKMEIQSQIVSECEEVERQYNTIKMSIEEYKALIKAILVKTGICEYSTNGGGHLN